MTASSSHLAHLALAALLTLALAALPCPCPSPTHASPSVQLVTSPVHAAGIEALTTSFGVQNPGLTVNFASLSNVNARCRIVNNCAASDTLTPRGQADVVGLDFPLYPSEYDLAPDLQVYPVMAYGVGAVYNVPGIPASDPLVLPTHVLADIFSACTPGRACAYPNTPITEWNDTRIVSFNPQHNATLQAAARKSRIIVIASNQLNFGPTSAFFSALTAANPAFAAMHTVTPPIPPSKAPTLAPTSKPTTKTPTQFVPTFAPTTTSAPSRSPSRAPSKSPSRSPTVRVTKSPTTPTATVAPTVFSFTNNLVGFTNQTVVAYGSVLGVLARVQTIPYSISFAHEFRAVQTDVPVAAVEYNYNPLDKVTKYRMPTPETINNALVEKLSNFSSHTDLPDKLHVNVSGARGADAWPIVNVAYLVVRKNVTRLGASCKTRRVLVRFLEWLYGDENGVPGKMVRTAGFYQLPAKQRALLLQRVREDIRCADGSRAVDYNITQTRYEGVARVAPPAPSNVNVTVDQQVATPLNAMGAQYGTGKYGRASVNVFGDGGVGPTPADVTPDKRVVVAPFNPDGSVTVTETDTNQRRARRALRLGGYAVSNQAETQARELQQQQGGARVVVPFAAIPFGFVVSGAGTTYLTLEVGLAILRGEITSWGDPRITSLVPPSTASPTGTFATPSPTTAAPTTTSSPTAPPSAPQPITVIHFAPDAPMRRTLETALARINLSSGLDSVPAAQSATLTSLADALNLVTITPGSITYGFIPNNAVAAISTVYRVALMRPSYRNGTRVDSVETISPFDTDSETWTSCVVPAANSTTGRAYFDSSNPMCWPLVVEYGLSIPASFQGAVCEDLSAQESVWFAHELLSASDSPTTSPLHNVGVPLDPRGSIRSLESVTCNGASIIAPVEDRSLVPVGLNQAAIVLASMGIVFTGLLCAYVIAYRDDSGKRLPGQVFVLQSLIGAVLQLAAVYPLTIQDETPTTYTQAQLDAACMATPWLYVMGFATAYAPVLARVWKFHAIYHNARLKKLNSDERLDSVGFQLFMFLPLLGLLILWQARDPLTWGRDPIVVDTYTGAVLVSRAGCSSDNLVPYLAPIIVFSFCTIVSGLVLAFVNRKEAARFQQVRSMIWTVVALGEALVLSLPILILVGGSPVASFGIKVVFILVTAVFTIATFGSPLLSKRLRWWSNPDSSKPGSRGGGSKSSADRDGGSSTILAKLGITTQRGAWASRLSKREGSKDSGLVGAATADDVVGGGIKTAASLTASPGSASLVMTPDGKRSAAARVVPPISPGATPSASPATSPRGEGKSEYPM